MHEAFRQGFAAGYGPILIIGSDCPEVSTALLEEAFRQLESFPVVLGPAADGGYYLLGMNHLVESLFRDKPWSTPAVLAETVAELQRAISPTPCFPSSPTWTKPPTSTPSRRPSGTTEGRPFFMPDVCTKAITGMCAYRTVSIVGPNSLIASPRF
jgi:hypothetical protein